MCCDRSKQEDENLKKRHTQSIIATAAIAMILAIATTAALVQALTSPRAQGAGSFLHEHEGMICAHEFVFSASSGKTQAQGGPQGAFGMFKLVCKNSNSICMVVLSQEIECLKVSDVGDGLSVTFEGLATVNMVNMGTGWMKGWWFRATGFDYGSPGKDADAFGLQLWDPAHWSGNPTNPTPEPPEGQHHCSGTLTSGNIVVLT